MAATTSQAARATSIPGAKHASAMPTSRRRDPVVVTLLELIETVGEITEDDEEVVATVIHMLRSGTVLLGGNFRSKPLSAFGA
jgi:hypothetical protein